MAKTETLQSLRDELKEARVSHTREMSKIRADCQSQIEKLTRIIRASESKADMYDDLFARHEATKATYEETIRTMCVEMLAT